MHNTHHKLAPRLHIPGREEKLELHTETEEEILLFVPKEMVTATFSLFVPFETDAETCRFPSVSKY